MKNSLMRLMVILSLLVGLVACGGGTSRSTTDAPPPPPPPAATLPADTYFSLAVTENSHNHTGAKLLFLDFQGSTPNSSVIQNNVVISPRITNGAIILDGNATDDWDAGLLTTVNGLVQNNYPLSEFIDAIATDITVGSAWDDDYIYFVVQWQDAGHTQSTRYKKWIFDGGQWNAQLHVGATDIAAPNYSVINASHTLLGEENEDRILMMFPMVDSENNFSANGLGCAAYCHTHLHDGSPYQNYTGFGMVSMHTNEEGDTADIWHWKSSRTVPSNRADDKHLVYAVGSGSGRTSDSGSSAYSSNALALVGGNPEFAHDIGFTYLGNELNLANRVAYGSVAGVPVINAEIPSVININPAGSRGDVETRSSFNVADNTWTVEFRRLRNTGNSDDHQFDFGDGLTVPTTTAVVLGNVATGETLYAANCVDCHQLNGSGVATIGASWSFPRIQRASGSLIHKAIQTVGFMQTSSLTSLTDQEVEDIAAYLQTKVTANLISNLMVSIVADPSITSSNVVSSSPAGINCPGDCSFDFVDTGVITLTASYVPGFNFTGWGGDAVTCGISLNCDVTMAGDQTVTANYATNTTIRTLTVTRNNGGTVRSVPAGIDCGSDCTEDYTTNNIINLTAIPVTGYQFDGWSGGVCDGSTNSTCEFIIDVDYTVTATFATLDCGTGVTYDAGGSNGFGRQLAVNIGAISSPTDIAFIPGTTDAFLVTSQSGRVYYFNGDCASVNSIMLNDVGITVIPPGGEQGLLNVEFHPDYESNGYVFFYHTSVARDTNSVSRATLSFNGNGDMILSGTVRIIDFKKNASTTNHDGGGLVFAPDKTLLASVGDGASSANGQRNYNLLGVVVRIEPNLSAAGGYDIPVSGNMFANDNPKCSGMVGAVTDPPCPEILAMGLRNPFRMSMAGNIVYLGDVGTGVEEVNSFDYTSVSISNPVNFGWSIHDGYVSSSSIDGYRNPIVYYNRDDTVADAFRTEDPEGNTTGSASIMIGDVYTGNRYGAELTNTLFFAEFYDGFMRAVGVDSNGDITDGDGVPGMHIIHHGQISSMVEGPDGYMYFTTLYGPAMVYRLVKP